MSTVVLDSRARRRAETRASLLEAAERAFRQHGYAEASLDGIARDAGFTKGAIYGLFDSKEDLYLALLDQRHSQLLDEISGILPAGPDQAGLLRSLGTWLADRIARDHDWILMNAEFYVLAARKPGLRARRAELLAREQVAFGQLLAPHLPGLDAERLSGMVLAIVDGLILQAVADPRHDVRGDLIYILERLFAEVPR